MKNKASILAEIEISKNKVLSQTIYPQVEQICEQLDRVFPLVWLWNDYDDLEHCSRVHPIEFILSESTASQEFLKTAMELNALFWEVAEVTIVLADLDERSFEDEDNILEFSELDYYQDFQFELNLYAISELFELGKLFERIETNLKTKYGEEPLIKYHEDIGSELAKYRALNKHFSKSGTEGGKRKGSKSITAAHEYIRRNYSNDIRGVKTKDLANEIFNAVSDLATILKKYGQDSEEYVTHDLYYLAGLIHPMQNKDGRPSSARKKGQVYSYAQIEKFIAKHKSQTTLSESSDN